MILAMSLVRRRLKGDPPLGVGREVGNDRTYQKRRIVIHGGAKADPFAQSDVPDAGVCACLLTGEFLTFPCVLATSSVPVCSTPMLEGDKIARLEIAG